jgi:spore coat protein SA
MKKVAIIAPNSLPVPAIRGGGIQNGIAEIIKHYENYKPYVFSKATYGVDNLPVFEIDGNAEHRRICLSDWEDFKIRFLHLSTKSYFPYVHLIAKQLKEIKPDIIHVRSRPWFIPLLRKYLGNSAKIILQNHNNYFMEMRSGQVKKYLDKIDAFAGVSRFTVDAEVLKRFPEKKDRCFVIYNGVNTEKFDPSALDRQVLEEFRKKFSISKDDIVVTYLGRIRPSKGVDILLNAVKKLIKEKGIRNLKLMLVGSNFFGGDTTVTPFMNELRATAEDVKDNIIFTGFIPRDEIEYIYGVTDIVSLPSLVEDASPNVCYEAQAMERPIISTRRGGIPEIVKENATTLLVDDPESADELAEKIHRLVKDPAERRSFGKNGRTRMLEGFTWKHAAKKTEEMYNKVLSF